MVELYIYKFRTERGLTQKELSILSGVSESYIGDLERNEKEPTISILCKLAKALKVKPEELYIFRDE